MWVQVGGIGLRVPEEEGLRVAAEIMARNPGQVGEVHDGDCQLGKVMYPELGPLVVNVAGSMTPRCSCTPFRVLEAVT